MLSNEDPLFFVQDQWAARSINHQHLRMIVAQELATHSHHRNTDRDETVMTGIN
jgi:hypothetical protein